MFSNVALTPKRYFVQYCMQNQKVASNTIQLEAAVLSYCIQAHPKMDED